MRTLRRALARKAAEEAKAKTDAEKAKQEAETARKDAEEAVSLDAETVEGQVAEEATEDVAAAIGKDVNDEVCPDDEYNVVDNIEKTAFRCFQCRMLFLPVSHIHGNEIVKYESCRRHKT